MQFIWEVTYKYPYNVYQRYKAILKTDFNKVNSQVMLRTYGIKKHNKHFDSLYANDVMEMILIHESAMYASNYNRFNVITDNHAGMRVTSPPHPLVVTVETWSKWQNLNRQPFFFLFWKFWQRLRIIEMISWQPSCNFLNRQLSKLR